METTTDVTSNSATPESSEDRVSSCSPIDPAATQEFDQPEQTESLAAATAKRIEELPRELGVLLVSVGVLGFVLPGIAGSPAIVAGGLVLWPKAFKRVDKWLGRKFPVVHEKSMEQLSRYLDDLERRYPISNK